MRNHVVLLLSGGLDSATLLYCYRARGVQVTCLSFDYGQRHRKELDCASRLAQGSSHTVLQLPNGLFAASSLTGGGSVPHGHYASESMRETVVPCRNLLFLSLAAAFAAKVGAKAVAYAAHGGDHTIYPDCRPEFVASLRETLRLSDWDPISIETPFIGMAKKEIAIIGKHLGVPFHLTWTCYEGGESPCGKCGSCVEREEALEGIS